MEEYIVEFKIVFGILTMCLLFFSLKYRSERKLVVILLLLLVTGINLYSYMTNGTMDVFWALVNIVVFYYFFIKYYMKKSSTNINDNEND